MDIPASDDNLCARGGWYPAFAMQPSAPPIWQTTAFDLDGLEQLESLTAGHETGYLYTRDGNPNHDAFAGDMARLERAEAAFVAASGMGAFTAAVLAHVASGDHIVAARVLYGRTSQLLQHLQSAFGIGVTFVDATDPGAFSRAVTPRTKLAVVESISNPLLEVADVPAIAESLGEIPLLVDSTFSTPCLLRPLEHGAALVFHSASKYLNGHGDVMLGVVAGRQSVIRRCRELASLFGVNSNPFECWLASRGLRTLPLRMERVSNSALQIARFLQSLPGVTRVYYPGLPEHSSHAVAKKLLTTGFGGMLSLELEGGRPAVTRLFRALGDRIPFSPTLADARTTFSYPAGTSHKFMTTEQRQQAGIGDGLVRVSIGLESAAELQHELTEGIRTAVTAQ